MLEKYSFSQIRTRLVNERALQIPEDGEKVVSELNLELIVRKPIILTVEKNR